METKTEITKIVTLTLNDAEAQWLKGIMQNPMWVDSPADENPTDKEMRRIFWEALS